MPKFLLRGTYTAAGVQGVLKEGGSSRRNAAEQATQSAGGKLESFYFAFGEDDFIAIIEAPDSASAVAASMAVNASGAVNLKTTVLITPEEVDQATKRSPSYRPPGT